jgi:hypothetical protein
MLRIRSTGYFKPNRSEQPTAAAKFQLPLAAEFMNVKSGALHVAARALRIVPTRTLTAHGDAGLLTRSKGNSSTGESTHLRGSFECMPKIDDAKFYNRGGFFRFYVAAFGVDCKTNSRLYQHKSRVLMFYR